MSSPSASPHVETETKTRQVLQFYLQEVHWGSFPGGIVRSARGGFFMSLSGKTRLWWLLVLLCITVAPLTFGWELQAPKKPHGKKQAQAKPLPPLPPGPLQPFALDQVPASPPQVSYQAGQLTITAQNSTLGDILRAVRSKTGASFDVPASATERVVGRLGPGPPREVLASLLNGSRYDYVMLGSAANPGAIDQLILSPKSGGSAAGAPPAEVSSFTQPSPGQATPDTQNAEETADNSDADNTTTDSTDADATQENADQGDQADAQGEDAQDNSQQQNGQQVRTPEQLLQELQQQQQRLQQQQQGLPPGQPQVVAPVPGQPPNSQPPHQE